MSLLKNVCLLFKGLLCSVYICLNIVIMCTTFYVFLLIKLISPTKALRIKLDRCLVVIAEQWVQNNRFYMLHLLGTQYDIRGLENLHYDRSYFIICNHQNWADIPILQSIFVKKVPFIRFFTKKELVWLPFLGPIFVGLHFPMMKRYSYEKIRKNPKLRDIDRATTKRVCQQLKKSDVSILSFLEGTRFTKQKHDKQQSPYRNLLKPKTGGLANSLIGLEGAITQLIDVTIVYPEGIDGFFSYISGEIPKIIIDVEVIDIPEAVSTGSFDTDPNYKSEIKEWVNDIWLKKDQKISTLSSSTE